MPYSNYPNGFSPGVGTGAIVRGLPLLQTYSGNILWVHSSGGNRGTFESPFTTLEIAMNSASAYDIIMVKAGHAEAISAATTFLCDVANVQIVGMGIGRQRPVITFDTATTASIPVSVANVAFYNMIFSANFADIVAPFTLTTANNFALVGCGIKATATNMNFLYVVDTNATSNDADGLTLVGNKWIEPDLATVSMVKMDGTNDEITVNENYVSLGVQNNKAALITIANGKIITNLDMDSNRVFRLNTDTATGAILVHTDGSTNTGTITRNLVQHADVAAELLVTASAGFATINNYASGVAGASGYLLPAADS